MAISRTAGDVRRVIDDWANALRAKDAEGVLALQAPDFVQFALAPPLQARALDRKGLEDWFSSWKGPIEYEICEQRVSAGEQVAFAHSLNRMRAETTDGHTTDMWFRQTLCFHRVGGDWKITHEHDSVPFYMNGEARAAIDLNPAHGAR